jgi:hypothetical protein
MVRIWDVLSHIRRLTNGWRKAEPALTLVIIGLQLTMRLPRPRLGPTWLAFPALAGAVAALVIPGPSGTMSAGAALLAVGALAMLAGHTWGLLVSIPSHVTLVGRLWPDLAHPAHVASFHLGAAAVVLVTAVPALALTSVVLPEIAHHLFHDRPRRTQALFVAASAVGLAASLIVPAL